MAAEITTCDPSGVYLKGCGPRGCGPRGCEMCCPLSNLYWLKSNLGHTWKLENEVFRQCCWVCLRKELLSSPTFLANQTMN